MFRGIVPDIPYLEEASRVYEKEKDDHKLPKWATGSAKDIPEIDWEERVRNNYKRLSDPDVCSGFQSTSICGRYVCEEARKEYFPNEGKSYYIVDTLFLSRSGERCWNEGLSDHNIRFTLIEIPLTPGVHTLIIFDYGSTLQSDGLGDICNIEDGKTMSVPIKTIANTLTW